MNYYVTEIEFVGGCSDTIILEAENVGRISVPAIKRAFKDEVDISLESYTGGLTLDKITSLKLIADDNPILESDDRPLMFTIEE